MNRKPAAQDVEEFKWIDRFSELLDSRFRIPGTRIRFGVDAVIGLVPYVGDVVSFAMSGTLVLAMVRRGASGMVVARMLWNILLDTVVGAIPILGDIFDVTYRANRRNYRLLKEHYEEGKHGGNAWPVVIAVAAFLVLLLGVTIWLIWELLVWVNGLGSFSIG